MAEKQARPANPERGETQFVLDGVEYVLRPSWEAIAAFEGATGKSLTELAVAASDGRLGLQEAGEIACACIRAFGRETDTPSMANVSAKKLAGLIYESEGGMLLAQKRFALMLTMAVTGGFTATGEPKAGAKTNAR